MSTTKVADCDPRSWPHWHCLAPWLAKTVWIVFRVISVVFVAAAFALMGGAVYYWFVLVMPLSTSTFSVHWWIASLFGVWVLYNIVYNYVRCMVTNTAAPLPKSDSSLPDETVRFLRDSDHDRFCKVCQIVTPPRAMHCMACGKCILGMDHHCPWIMGCVGYFNHPYFFLFLFYACFGCCYIMVWTVPMFYRMQFHRETLPKFEYNRHGLGLTLSTLMPAVCSVCAGGMGLWHAYVLSKNLSSLEITENWRQVRRWRKSGYRGRFRHAADNGTIENWKAVFGVIGKRYWWIEWCMPTTHRRSGDGMATFHADPLHQTTAKVRIANVV